MHVHHPPAGIACNKMLAKLVGGVHKPDDQTILPPPEAWVSGAGGAGPAAGSAAACGHALRGVQKHCGGRASLTHPNWAHPAAHAAGLHTCRHGPPFLQPSPPKCALAAPCFAVALAGVPRAPSCAGAARHRLQAGPAAGAAGRVHSGTPAAAAPEAAGGGAGREHGWVMGRWGGWMGPASSSLSCQPMCTCRHVLCVSRRSASQHAHASG